MPSRPNGAISMFAAQGWRQIAQIITLVVVARALGPIEMGLFGMAAVISNFLLQFKDLGMGAALIHDRSADQQTLSTAFWAMCGIGAVSSVALAVLAWPAAAFFHEPRLVGVLSGLAISFVLIGPGVVPQALLERAMSFRLVAVVESVGVTIGCGVGVALAYLGAGVWSLVAQTVLTSAVVSAGMVVAGRWRPRFVFIRSTISGMAGYGLEVSGFTLVNYWVRNADNLLVGRILGSAALGVYSMAYRMMLWPVQNLSNVVGRLAFPAFVSLRDDMDRLAATYLKAVRLIALVVFPVMMIAMALSEQLVLLLLGTKWVAVVIPFAILAPVGMLQSVGTTVGQLFQATGNTRTQLLWALWTAPVYVAAFAVGLQWGLEGVATAYAVVSVILFIPGMRLGLRCVGSGLRELVRSLAVPVAVAVLAGVASYGVSVVAQPLGLLLSTVLAATAGVLVWVLMALNMAPEAAGQFKRAFGMHGLGGTA